MQMYDRLGQIKRGHLSILLVTTERIYKIKNDFGTYKLHEDMWQAANFILMLEGAILSAGQSINQSGNIYSYLLVRIYCKVR